MYITIDIVRSEIERRISVIEIVDLIREREVSILFGIRLTLLVVIYSLLVRDRF